MNGRGREASKREERLPYRDPVSTVRLVLNHRGDGISASFLDSDNMVADLDTGETHAVMSIGLPLSTMIGDLLHRRATLRAHAQYSAAREEEPMKANARKNSGNLDISNSSKDRKEKKSRKGDKSIPKERKGKNETKFLPLDRVQKRSETFNKRFAKGRPEYMLGTIKRIKGEICYVLWDDPEVYTSGSMARLIARRGSE